MPVWKLSDTLNRSSQSRPALIDKYANLLEHGLCDFIAKIIQINDMAVKK